MVRALKKIIHRLSHKPSFWNLLYVFSAITGFNSFRERLLKIKAERIFFKKLAYNTTILRGPFSGLVYPRLQSSYSELAPKILGSYEAELFTPLQEILAKNYYNVIDIGCAEGYYAVGIAIKMPSAEIYAYDINPEALKMCYQMARLNKVADRVHLRAECSADTLKHFNFAKKSLIVCDCEGYELQLFNKENISNLSNCDLLIELHDILGLDIKQKLLPVFYNSHIVQLISSEDRQIALYPELEGMDDHEKRIVLSECRDGLFGSKRMEWAYIKSKN